MFSIGLLLWIFTADFNSPCFCDLQGSEEWRRWKEGAYTKHLLWARFQCDLSVSITFQEKPKQSYHFVYSYSIEPIFYIDSLCNLLSIPFYTLSDEQTFVAIMLRSQPSAKGPWAESRQLQGSESCLPSLGFYLSYHMASTGQDPSRIRDSSRHPIGTRCSDKKGVLEKKKTMKGRQTVKPQRVWRQAGHFQAHRIYKERPITNDTGPVVTWALIVISSLLLPQD